MADEQTLDTNPQEQQANEALAGDELAARVQSLEEQLAAAQDQSLRMAADLQNVRRRAEQDVEKAYNKHDLSKQDYRAIAERVKQDQLLQIKLEKIMSGLR